MFLSFSSEQSTDKLYVVNLVSAPVPRQHLFSLIMPASDRRRAADVVSELTLPDASCPVLWTQIVASVRFCCTGVIVAMFCIPASTDTH